MNNLDEVTHTITSNTLMPPGYRRPLPMLNCPSLNRNKSCEMMSLVNGYGDLGR
jgi:hypothetical protein